MATFLDPGDLARALAGLQGEGPAPLAAPSSAGEWYFYALGAGQAPQALAALAAIVALCLAAHLGRATEAAPRDAGKSQLLGLFTALLVAMWLCAAGAMLIGLQSLDGSTQLLVAVASDLRSAHTQLLGLNASSDQLASQVINITSACHGLDQLLLDALGQQGLDEIRKLEEGAKKELTEYQMAVTPPIAVLGALDAPVSQAIARLGLWRSFLKFSFLVPPKVAVLSVIVLAAAVAARGLGGGVASAVESVGLGRLSSVCFAAVTFGAAATAAVQLGLCVAAGGSCTHPDASALQAASRAGMLPGVLNVVSDFVAGQDAVLLKSHLLEAHGKAEDVSAMLLVYQKQLDVTGLLCDAVSGAGLLASASRLERQVAKVLQLVGGARMHGFYADAVHDGFCGEGLQAIFVSFVCHALLGFLCLPLSAALAQPALLRAVGEEEGLLGADGDYADAQAPWGYDGYDVDPMWQPDQAFGSAAPGLHSTSRSHHSFMIDQQEEPGGFSPRASRQEPDWQEAEQPSLMSSLWGSRQGPRPAASDAQPFGTI